MRSSAESRDRRRSVGDDREDLAERVSGTLVDAKNLAGHARDRAHDRRPPLGVPDRQPADAVIGHQARTGAGTLKALGWSQGLVVRQVTGESLLQGLLGGALGIVSVSAARSWSMHSAPTLEATVAAAAERACGSPGRSARAGRADGDDVALDAPVSPPSSWRRSHSALLGGLVAGAVGSLRASRLRSADALRHID